MTVYARTAQYPSTGTGSGSVSFSCCSVQTDLGRFFCMLVVVGAVNTVISVRLHLDFPAKPFEKLNWQNASVRRGLIQFKIKQNTGSKLQELHWKLETRIHCLGETLGKWEHVYLLCWGCFVSSKKINQPKHSPQTNWQQKGCSEPKELEFLVKTFILSALSRLGTWSQGSCQQLLTLMLSAFQDRLTSQEQVFNQSSIWSLHYNKLMIKSLFSPLINVILKLGKMSTTAVIAGNSGFSSKSWNSKLCNFHRHGPQCNSIGKEYQV